MAGPGDTPFKPFAIPLTGKWITSEDPLLLGEGDFSILTNMRYTQKGIRGVMGMTKYNSTACNSTYKNIRSAHHFSKQYPTEDESHMLVQAFNTAGTGAAVYENSTAIGSAGDFTATALTTDTNSPKIGKFATAPYGTAVYCNGNNNKVWGGNGIKVGKLYDMDGPSYVKGDDGYYYECTKSHTSAADDEPGRTSPGPTSNWSVYWQLASEVDSALPWESGIQYDSAYFYDYTVHVNNGIDDQNNNAIVNTATVASSLVDTTVLLKMENSAADSSGNGHDYTNNGGVAFSPYYNKFGSYGAYFNGSSYLSHTTGGSGDALFNLYSYSGWTIDFWMYVSSAMSSSYKPVYYQKKDTSNYILIEAARNTYTGYGGTSYYVYVRFSVYSGGTLKVSHIGYDVISDNSWNHVAVIENSGTYAVCVNGKGYFITDADRPPDMSGSTVYSYIGYDGTNYLTCYGIDEFRISTVARWNEGYFTPPSDQYSTAPSYRSTLYVGSIIPIKGITFDISTANTESATSKVYYWSASGKWVEAPGFSDGTASSDGVTPDPSGKTLRIDGSMTFTDTAGGIAYPSLVKDIYLYWYKIVVTGAVTSGTSINKISLQTSMQDIPDIWDGTYRPVIGYIRWDGTNYIDETLNVTQDRWIVGTDGSTKDPSSFSNIGDMLKTTVSGKYLYFGFLERASGIRIKLIPEATPQNNQSKMSVDYWNGNSWTTVSGLYDGTSLNGATLARSGTVTWTATNEINEYKTSVISGASVKTGTTLKDQYSYSGTSANTTLYYYRVSVSAALDDFVKMYYCDSMAAPKEIRGHRYPAVWQDRLFLACEDKGRKNQILISAAGTLNVFNGIDSYRMYLGDESDITAVGGMMNRFGAEINDALIVCKEKETWMVYWRDQNVTPGFYYRKLHGQVGCISPNTFISCDTGIAVAPGVNRNVIIWLSATGVAMYDQASVTYIHQDIQNYFDPWRNEYLDFTLADKFYADFDARNQEYHLYVASTAAATDINLELVYSLPKKAWFKIDRTSSKPLNGSCSALTANGDYKSYGFDSSGIMYTLEDGKTFDGQGISYNFRTGAKALGGLMAQTIIRKVRLMCVKKDTTTNKVTIKDYIDCSSTPKTASTLSISDADSRVAFDDNRGIRSVDFGPGFTHELDFSITTSDENIGFEPLIVGGSYKVAREEMGG